MAENKARGYGLSAEVQRKVTLNLESNFCPIWYLECVINFQEIMQLKIYTDFEKNLPPDDLVITEFVPYSYSFSFVAISS